MEMVHIIASIAMLASLAFVLTISSPAAAQLTNGGFEQLDERGFPVDWNWFTSSPEDVTVRVEEDSFEGRHALLMEARKPVTVGVNRSYVPGGPGIGAMLSEKKGALVFRFKLMKCESDNVRIYAIPMKADNLEGGAARAEYIIPSQFAGDGRWHIGVLSFDFTDKPDVRSVQIGLRINEGGKPAPATVIFDDIRFAEHAGWHLRIASLGFREGEEAGKEGMLVLRLQNTGDDPAPVRVSFDAGDEFKLSLQDVPKTIAPGETGEVRCGVRGLRKDGTRFIVGWDVSPGVHETTDLICRAQIRLRSFGFANPVSFIGGDLKLHMVLENDGNAVVEGIRIALDIGDNLTLVRGQGIQTLGIFAPGERKIEWQLRPKDVGIASARVFVEAKGAGFEEDATIVISRPIEEKEGIVVSAKDVRLIFPRNPYGYGVFAVEVYDGEGWRRMGDSPYLLFIRYVDSEGKPVKCMPFADTAKRLDGSGVSFPISWYDAKDGMRISGEVRIEPDGQALRFSWGIKADKRMMLLGVHSPTIFVGDNAFGREKGMALLPGIYWLMGDETITDKRYSDPPHHAHFVPHPYKLTQPMMVLEHGGAFVGLMWDALQNWLGGEGGGAEAGICPQPVFIVPNEIADQDNHMIGLMLPNVPKWVKENSLFAERPMEIPEGRKVGLSSWLIGGRGGILNAYDAYFAKFSLPPIPERPYSDEETFKRSKAGKRSDRYGRLPAGLQALEHNAVESAKTQRDDGSWAFSIDRGWTLEMLKKFAPHRPLDDYGRDGDTTIGTCTFVNGRATAILRYARITGSQTASRLGMKAIEFIDKAFSRPEGAQTWEVPLHCPDVLASANAIHAYLEAWRLTGDGYWLERAIYWAKTGLPFIYLWNPPDRRTMMRYASIPVFGTSFFTAAPWFGTPVQWNGLDYAYALFPLAKALKEVYGAGASSIWQDAGFWRHIAEGITVCGIQQQAAVGHPDGNYPDSVSLTYRYGPNDKGVINPAGIVRNLWLIHEEHDDAWDYETTFVDETPIRITSEAVVKAAHLRNDLLSLTLRKPEGISETNTIVACIEKPKEIHVNGRAIEGVSGCSWHYDQRRKMATIKIAHDSETISLEVIGAKPAIYEPLGVVWEKPWWDFELDRDDWMPTNHLAGFEVKDGVLITSSAGDDPYMHSPAIEVDATKYRRLVMRIRLRFPEGTQPIGQLFWIREDDRQWSEGKSIRFQLPTDGEWHELRLDPSQSPEWKGKITQIRLDPGSGKGIGIEIDYIGLQ